MPLHPRTQETLDRIREKAGDRRVVFVSGNFNILHPGHLRLLRFAKECGDHLVVGLFGPDSPGAYIHENLRLEGVQSIHWVDTALLLADPLEDFLRALRPTFVVKGSEHERGPNPESAILEAYGGRLLFGSGEISFSSVDLLKREWGEINFSTIKRPHDYLERRGITQGQELDLLSRMGSLRVCVVGDTIVDEYITCDPLGMSQEDPTIVVTPVMQERFVGGAAIVAAHARGLGSKVHFFSVLGQDETAAFVRAALKSYGVDFHCFKDESRPTTLKQRFRADQKTLLRVSRLRQHDISAEIRGRMLAGIRRVLDEVDLVIFSDFNYGCLPQSLVSTLVEECGRRSIIMAADSQSSSQMGDVSRFKGMKLITPTEREARLAVQDFDSGLVVLAERLKQKSRAENVAITLGAEGILIQAGEERSSKWPTDRLPALNTAPKDVAGAGDSFLTGAAMALAAGADIWQASYLGSLAAACQVGRIGNVPLTRNDLTKEISF